MRDLHGTTLAGTETLLDEAAVKALQARLRGVLICPEMRGTSRPVRSGMA